MINVKVQPNLFNPNEQWAKESAGIDISDTQINRSPVPQNAPTKDKQIKGPVVKRKRAKVQTAEEKMARLAKRREIVRLSTQRYRKRLKMTKALEDEIKSLQTSIEKSAILKATFESKLLGFPDTVISARGATIKKLWRCIKQGMLPRELGKPSASQAAAITEAFVPDISFNGASMPMFLKQWRQSESNYTDLTNELFHVQSIDSSTFTIRGVAGMQFTEEAIKEDLPHIADDKELCDEIMKTRFLLPCANTYYFEGTSTRITSSQSSCDFFTAWMQALGSVEKVLKVMGGSASSDNKACFRDQYKRFSEISSATT